MKKSPVLSALMFLVVGCIYQINGISETKKKQFNTPSPIRVNNNFSRFNHQPVRGPDGQYQVLSNGLDLKDFPSKVRAGDYTFLYKEYEGFTPARYIQPAKDKSDYLLLYCYMDKDPKTKLKFYVAAIKTLENKALFHIIGFRCLPEWDLKQNNIIRVEKKRSATLQQQRTFHIAVRDSRGGDGEGAWKAAAICVDCGDTTGKPDTALAQQGEQIYWSKPAVEWKRGEKKDYEYSRDWIARQYVSSGNTKFVLVCIKDETPNTGQVMRSASGEFVVKVNFEFDCTKSPKSMPLQMFFVTESSQGKLSLHTKTDCDRVCDVNVGGNNKRSWLYYFAKEDPESKTFVSVFTFRENDGMEGNLVPNSCTNLSRKNIKLTLLYNSPNRRKIGDYTSGTNFKITCFEVSLPKQTLYYADISYKGQIFISIDNFNCEQEVRGSLPNKFITTTHNDDDISQVVVGSYDRQWTHDWCAYNVMKILDTDDKYIYDIELYYGYKPDASLLTWKVIST